MKMVNYPQCLISALLLILFGCENPKNAQPTDTPLPYYNQADFTPVWPKHASEVENFHTIDNFSFQNQNGDFITNKSLEGKIYVADFFFTICPSICPKMTSNLSRIQEEFKEDSSVKLVSFSVMPWVDSVSVLNDYGKVHDINANQWYLLTGETDAIYKLARESYFAEKEIGLNRNSNEFLHTENFVLIDVNGHIRGVYNGTIPFEMIRLSEDIRTLISLG
jgi:protein SCO1/2